jgi:hypothetical protein
MSVLEWVMSVNPVAETASASVGQWRPDASVGDVWADADAPGVVPVDCEADGCAPAEDAALNDAEAADDLPPLP